MDNEKLGDFEKIKAVNILSVKTDALSYAKQKYFVYIVFPSLAAFILLTTLFVMILGGKGLEKNLENLLFYCLIYLVITFSILIKNSKDKFMKDFADAMNYSYSKVGNLGEGTLFNFGNNRQATDEISGKYLDKDFRLFLYSATIGEGKNKTTYSFSVLELTFDALLPNIILYSKHIGNTLPIVLDSEKITLEGNFNEFFSLRVPKGYENEAYQIFTPDIMQIFIRDVKNMNFEFYKNKVYLFSHSPINDKGDLVTLFGLSADIILNLSDNFLSMKSDVASMEDYVKLT